MMSVIEQFEPWRCCHDDDKFCPDEGCAKVDGCARDAGWLPGMDYVAFLAAQKLRDEVARLGT
tara:strand:+ start:23512 stop:23700 length:189 start_codon:yes stop_codon:yes gene_type:complete